MVFIFLSGFGLIFEFSNFQIFKISNFRIGISVRIHIVSNVVVVVSKDLRNKLDWTYHALKRVCLFFVCLFVLGFGVGLLMLGICLYFGCLYVVVIFTLFFYANLSLVLDYSFFSYMCTFFG